MTTLTEANVEQAALSPVHPPTERLCTTTAARPDQLERAALCAWPQKLDHKLRCIKEHSPLPLHRPPSLLALREIPQGKTFPLKRWQKELEKDQFRAIYYNAWEDDFCDDPLLSIIGQLSGHFKKGNLETLADEMGKIAIPLLKKNAVSTLTSTLQGTTIHIDFQRRRRRVCAAPD